MEFEAWIKKKKELNAAILSFLESETLAKIIDDQEIDTNEKSTLELFQLLYKIDKSRFLNRLGQIFEYLTKKAIKIDNIKIAKIFSKNKRLLLLLFEHKVIIPDESILKYLIEIDYNNTQKLNYYLFPEIKNFLDEEKRKSIENEIKQQFNENIETFESKIYKGENESLICKLIREDSIQEFISFINQTNFSLTSTIKADFYESNSFLIANKSSLIEYAFFYGSIQIIKYLQNNHAEIPSGSWLYAIHSNNPEMIEFLEDNKIEFYNKYLAESIECYHNDITNYIIDKLLDKSQDHEFINYMNHIITECCNYYYFPDDIINIISNPQKEKFKMHLLTKSLTNITIPSSVTSIGDHAFEDCSSLTQISIPSSITSIGNCAFKSCSSLTQISIPSSITSIGNDIFSGCSSLAKISIPSSVTSIGDSAFCGCLSLTEISIPSSVTSIENHTFYGCSSLAQILIPSSVTSIKDYAFCGCSSLTQISIPSSVTSIGENTFFGCSSLAQISIPSSVTSIKDYAFYGCSSLTQISIPSSITSIENNVFAECSSLAQVSIPSSVISIENYGFCRCISLIQITIPSSVTSIRNNAFFGCTSLTEILIPSSVASIGVYAFCGFSSLTKITILSSEISISRDAFYGCSSLTQISTPKQIYPKYN